MSGLGEIIQADELLLSSAGTSLSHERREVILKLHFSVADPDLGSGLRCLFDPWTGIPNPYF